MENVDQCNSCLIYNSFTVVFIQTFTITDSAILEEKHANVTHIENSIDCQIFNLQVNLREKLIKRYILKGFNIKVELENKDDPVISGYVHVEASVFFNNTVSITYRFVVDPKHQLNWKGEGFVDSSEPFNTDQLITFAGIPLGTEHWSAENENQKTEIDSDVKAIHITNLFVDEEGNWTNSPKQIKGKKGAFIELQERYKKLFQKDCRFNANFRDYHFVFIDVWEDIGHASDCDFGKMREGEIIEHIEKHHQAELIGLFTLYPYEWPYRMASEFHTICGVNIAIDTDDLILTNQNISAVFGTYGLRGKDSPTDWQTHLNERAFYHVSWPEYLLIVEIILAKKQAINNAMSRFIYSTIKVTNQKNTRKLIEDNALLSLDISNLLLKLDAVRFSRYTSHKVMYERTTEQLGLQKDLEQLENSMNQIDQALNNVTNIREIRQANLLNFILGIISVASLFGIILTPAEIPFFISYFHSKDLSTSTGNGIMFFTFVLIISSALAGFYILIKNRFYRKR